MVFFYRSQTKSSNRIKLDLRSFFLNFIWLKIFWSQINCVLQQFASSYLFVDFFTLKCFGVYHLTIKQSLFSLAKLKVDFFNKLVFTFPLTKITKLWSPHSISLLTKLSNSSKSRKSKQYKRNNFLWFSQPFKVLSKSFQKINR